MARIPVGVVERLRPPRSASTIIDRASLIERMRLGLDGQVVVLRAPTGFGKTALMAAAYAILRREGVPAAWLSLAPSDADPSALATSIARAALGSDPPGGPATTLEALFDVLALDRSEPLSLFLDGVHADHAAAVGALMRQAPEGLRLALAVSGEADLPLARLRLRQLLVEIGAGDLCFSRAETRQLLDRHLAPSEFEAFHAAIGGWPALVRLAVARLAEGADGAEREAILAGTHRDYRGFLHEELHPALRPDIARLVRAGAFLDEVPVALVCALADVAPARAAAALDALAPLMTRLPQRPGWFALHPLIRAATTAATAEAGEIVPHLRAALWFAVEGHIDKAVHHAGLAGDFAFAAEMIRTAGGVSLFLRVGYRVLHGLMSEIPRGIVERSPDLQLCAALVLAKEGQLQAAREHIEELKRQASSARADHVPDEVLRHIDGLIDIYEDCRVEQREIDAMEAKLRGRRLRDTWVRGWLHNHLCIAYTRQGQLRLARLHALKALDCYREENTTYAQSFLLIHLSFVSLLGGRISAATAYSRQAEDLIQRTQWSDENLLAIARIPVAETLYQQGQVRAADATLAEALPVVARGEGWVDVFASGFVTYARCRQRLEGAVAALAVVDRAEEVAEDRRLPRLGLVARILRVEILTRDGLLDSAALAAADLPDLDDDAAWPTRRENRQAWVTLARLTLRRGDAASADVALNRFRATRRDEDDALVCLAAEILSSESALALHDVAEAGIRLNRAVAAAQPQDLVEPFAAEGKPVQELVRSIVRRLGLGVFGPKVTAFVDRVVAMHVDSTPPSAGVLSARENDVLALLARGLSNKQIAREIGISEATTKFHLKRLFAKLGASRRTMAVAIARAMGLIKAG